MTLDIWTGKDYEAMDVPDAIVQPLTQYLLKNRQWDRDMVRLNRLVMNTRLDITDWLIQRDQQAPPEAALTVAEVAEAEAIVDAVEIR